MDAAWLLLLGLSLGGSVLWSGARKRAPSQAPSLTIALTVAALDAARRGHAEVLPEHVLFAALFQRERTEAVRDKVEARLEAIEAASGPLDSSGVQLSKGLLGAIAHASRRAMSAMRPLTVDDVLAALAHDASISALLDEARHVPEPAASSARTLVGAPYRAPTPDDRAEVLIWNDDVSTMAGVLEVLRECFAKGEPEALHLMLTTHYLGQAVVGRYPWEDGKHLVARATAHARAAGMPLQITLNAPGDRSAEKPEGIAARLRRFFSSRPSP